MPAPLVLPEPVQRKARALGTTGAIWLRELPDLIAGLETDWGCRVGDTLAGGSAAFVATATTSDGTASILKVAMPEGLEGGCPFDVELDVLLAVAGSGYPNVLASDRVRRAVLMERLGRPLSSTGLGVDAQIDVMAATLCSAWRPVPAGFGVRTGVEQADFLNGFIRSRFDRLSAACSARTIAVAVEYTGRRRRSIDAGPLVLVHGDVHPDNVLEDPTGVESSGFKLIDPDPMASEPAHDLGIVLRDFSRVLLASDDPASVGRAWCSRIASLSGVADADAIWEWALIERVSTGLFLTDLGDDEGALFLRVADLWSAAD